MPRYKCKHRDCTNYNEIITKNTVIQRIKGEVFHIIESCSSCNAKMKLLAENGFIVMIHGEPRIGNN